MSHMVLLLTSASSASCTETDNIPGRNAHQGAPPYQVSRTRTCSNMSYCWRVLADVSPTVVHWWTVCWTPYEAFKQPFPPPLPPSPPSLPLPPSVLPTFLPSFTFVIPLYLRITLFPVPWGMVGLLIRSPSLPPSFPPSFLPPSFPPSFPPAFLHIRYSSLSEDHLVPCTLRYGGPLSSGSSGAWPWPAISRPMLGPDHSTNTDSAGATGHIYIPAGRPAHLPVNLKLFSCRWESRKDGNCLRAFRMSAKGCSHIKDGNHLRKWHRMKNYESKKVREV